MDGHLRRALVKRLQLGMERGPSLKLKGLVTPCPKATEKSIEARANEA